MKSFFAATIAVFAFVYAVYAVTLWDPAFVVRLGAMDAIDRFAAALMLVVLPVLAGGFSASGSIAKFMLPTVVKPGA